MTHKPLVLVLVLAVIAAGHARVVAGAPPVIVKILTGDEVVAFPSPPTSVLLMIPEYHLRWEKPATIAQVPHLWPALEGRRRSAA